jgi:hypothetical protein
MKGDISMNKNRGIRTVAAIFFILFLIIASVLEAKTFDSIKKQIKKYTLSNGMTRCARRFIPSLCGCRFRQ